jgi:hypothetical protein
MKKNLIYYFIISLLDLMVLHSSSKQIFTSVVESDIWGALIFSLLFSLIGDSFIRRYINFAKYYPNFEDKWLTF